MEEKRKAGGGAAVEGRRQQWRLSLLAEKTQKGATQGTWMARAEQDDIDPVATALSMSISISMLMLDTLDDGGQVRSQ